MFEFVRWNDEVITYDTVRMPITVGMDIVDTEGT
jgi:hypothetical protein